MEIRETENNYSIIQELTVKHIVDNCSIYNSVIAGDMSYRIAITDESNYFRLMLKNGSYGGVI